MIDCQTMEFLTIIFGIFTLSNTKGVRKRRRNPSPAVLRQDICPYVHYDLRRGNLQEAGWGFRSAKGCKPNTKASQEIT